VSAGQPSPYVGADVFYQSYGTPAGEYTSVPRAAKITAVTDPAVADRLTVPVADLVVFNPTGLFFNQLVRYDGGAYAPPNNLGEPSGPSFEGGTWHWPYDEPTHPAYAMRKAAAGLRKMASALREQFTEPAPATPDTVPVRYETTDGLTHVADLWRPSREDPE
jgi:hypothetical protein